MKMPIANGADFVEIDEEDYFLLKHYRWTRIVTNKGFKKYAQTSTLPRITMHRLLMGDIPEGHVVDHINHNGLDNRRCNLRVITKKQNQANRRAKRGGTSTYLGVYRNKQGKYVASIGLGNKKTKTLGQFVSEIDAAKCYNKYARIVHGEYANLNIIHEQS